MLRIAMSYVIFCIQTLSVRVYAVINELLLKVTAIWPAALRCFGVCSIRCWSVAGLSSLLSSSMRRRFLCATGFRNGSSIAGHDQFSCAGLSVIEDKPLINSSYPGDSFKDTSSSVSMCNVSRITGGHV